MEQSTGKSARLVFRKMIISVRLGYKQGSSGRG